MTPFICTSLTDALSLTYSRGSVVADFVLLTQNTPSMTPQEAGHRLQDRLQQVATSPTAAITALSVEVAREWRGIKGGGKEGDAAGSRKGRLAVMFD